MFVPGLFDTHCHLDFAVFADNRTALLEACAESGLAAIMIPAVAADRFETVQRLCLQQPVCGVSLYMALGLHPCFIEQHREEHLDTLARTLEDSNAAVAVGEIGLDFWPGSMEHEQQIKLFEAQLDIARRLQLPVIIHSRKANDQVLKRLRQRPDVQGVIHAFSGSHQQAQQFIDQGFKLGIGGAVTYPRAQRLRAIVAEVPLQALVLETDAPDMPICGRQGEINRPDYLPQILAVVQQLRQEPAAELRGQLWRNSCELFGLG